MSTTTMIAETVSSSPGSVVNGIDTDAVHMLIDEVDSDAAKGMTHWRVASSWQGGSIHARKSTALRWAVSMSHAVLRSTSTSLLSWAAATLMRTRKNTCSL